MNSVEMSTIKKLCKLDFMSFDFTLSVIVKS